MALNLLEKLRELLTAAEAGEGDADEIEAAAAEVDEADEAEADEVEADEVEADEVEAGAAPEDIDSAEVDEVQEVDDAQDADLRATITRQAAEIETLRNTIATLGGEVEVDDVDALEDDTDDDLVVGAFEDDYAKRQAALAEIKEN